MRSRIAAYAHRVLCGRTYSRRSEWGMSKHPRRLITLKNTTRFQTLYIKLFCIPNQIKQKQTKCTFKLRIICFTILDLYAGERAGEHACTGYKYVQKSFHVARIFRPSGLSRSLSEKSFSIPGFPRLVVP